MNGPRRLLLAALVVILAILIVKALLDTGLLEIRSSTWNSAE